MSVLLGVVTVVAAACDSPERVRPNPEDTLPPLPPTVSVRRVTTTTMVVTVTYVVQRGDTFGRIARQLNIDPGILAAANGVVDQNRIEEGQVLVVPTTTTQPS
jgi:LysM repeat protein